MSQPLKPWRTRDLLDKPPRARAMTNERTLQQRAMSFLSTLQNTGQYDRTELSCLIQNMLNENWHLAEHHEPTMRPRTERALLDRAVDVMAALHRAIEPMEDDPELAGRVPPAAIRAFVDALADIDRERCRRAAKPVGCPNCREVYEIWAGSEGFTPQTAPEGYQQRLIEQMRDAAAKGKEVFIVSAAESAVKCNQPFERLPQHETDPGFGPVPPPPKVMQLHQVPAEPPASHIHTLNDLDPDAPCQMAGCGMTRRGLRAENRPPDSNIDAAGNWMCKVCGHYNPHAAEVCEHVAKHPNREVPRD